MGLCVGAKLNLPFAGVLSLKKLYEEGNTEALAFIRMSDGLFV